MGFCLVASGFNQDSIPKVEPRVITYRATLDLLAETVSFVARALAAHRARNDDRPWQRTATPFEQAVIALRGYVTAATSDSSSAMQACRPRPATATSHEAVDMIAAHAPIPHEALTGGAGAREFACLDGTLIGCTRSSQRSGASHDLWISGKHRRHGGTTQALTDPAGLPLWVSDVEPE